MGTSEGGEATFERGAGSRDSVLFGDELADGQVTFLKEKELFEDGEHGFIKHSVGRYGKGNRRGVVWVAGGGLPLPICGVAAVLAG